MRLPAVTNADRSSMGFAAMWPWSSTATRLSAVTSASASLPTKSHTLADPGEVLEEWSSLIGIVTAIVGNVLIAIALNVQRYAHTRLHKERRRIRQRARALTRSSQSNRNSGSYGTISAITNGHGASAGVGVQDVGKFSVICDSAPDGTRDREADPLSGSIQSVPESDDDDMNANEEKATSNYLKSPYWWLGQVLISLGEMGNFLAYGFAPASIVSPLGVVALISNCIIAPVMFHERFRARDFWGVAIAVAGVVTVVFSAKQEETKLEPHDVWDAITTMAFEIYLGVTVFLIIVLMWASGRYGRRTILIDLGLVGLFGGYTALATKGVSSMLSSTLWRAFTTPVTYILIFILLITAVMQIRYVNKALQRFDSTQVIPIQFVLFTLCVILGSAVLYRDFEKTTPTQAAYFVGGCLLTFFGVFLITSGRQQKEQDDEDEDLLSEVDGIEENIGLSSHEQEALVLGVQEESPRPVTPMSRSRRSSRISRISFADACRPAAFQDRGLVPALGQKEASENVARLIEIEPPTTTVECPRQETLTSSSALAPRGNRNPFTVAADVATAESSSRQVTGDSSNMMPPMRVPGASAAIFGASEPRVPSRPSTAISRTSGHHHSNTFISPSPLSSTVTTVMKDGFLGNKPSSWAHRPSLRRIRSSMRASLFFNDGLEEQEHGIARLGYTALPTSEAPSSHPGDSTSTPGNDAPRRRSRSVSDVISELFWSPKKNKGTGSKRDVEAESCRNSRHGADEDI
ncbi:hypothetical protein E4U43_004844 [Claviceps pusilla]|uniref:DUF803 domain membrane protein n=1 Tax=Claviceps pusilla TaxID=123648 RepID=A0A9P7SWK7_9HYPO|nr:hypothetical protein E4U43_004844 [Claviceps pusilla]